MSTDLERTLFEVGRVEWDEGITILFALSRFAEDSRDAPLWRLA